MISYRSFKWFLIPLIAPYFGGFIGAWVYQFFVGMHIPSEIDELEEEVRRIQHDKTHTSPQIFNNSNKPSLHHSTPYHISTITPRQQVQENGVVASSIPKTIYK